MIDFQKEYLKIIQQQNTKHIITEGIGIDTAFNFFTDLIPSTDSILGNSQQQAQTNIQGIIDKTVGKFATFSQPITNINTKGKKLQKNITKPYQTASNGGNVDEEIQKSAEKSSKWSKAVIVKEFQKKARSQGLKFKGLSSEALNSPQIINQERKLILQYKKDLSKHIKKLIIQDAKKGITPNMWFDVNAKQSDQQPIIFEDITYNFKINDGKLICEEIQNKSKKRYLISESIINNILMQDFQAIQLYMSQKGYKDFDITKYISSYGNSGQVKQLNWKKIQEDYPIVDDELKNKLQHTVGSWTGKKSNSAMANNQDVISTVENYKPRAKKKKKKTTKTDTNSSTTTGATTDAATGATTDAATGATTDAATGTTTDAATDATTDAATDAATGAAAGTTIKDKLKLMWTKIKQGIDKFVRFIGKIVLAVIAFIMTLMWFLIRLVIEGAKAVMKIFGKGSGGSFKGWNTCKADVNKLLGVNKPLAERIAGYLSLVLVGGAIMVMTLSSSNSDTENAQPPINQIDMDLSLIADFEV